MAAEHVSRRSPDRPPTHPGVFLNAVVLPDQGLTNISDVANRLKVSRQHLYGILNGRTDVTPGMALRLSKLFGYAARLWLNMQRAHDLWHAEREMADELAAITPMPTPMADEDENDDELAPLWDTMIRGRNYAVASVPSPLPMMKSAKSGTGKRVGFSGPLSRDSVRRRSRQNGGPRRREKEHRQEDRHERDEEEDRQERDEERHQE